MPAYPRLTHLGSYLRCTVVASVRLDPFHTVRSDKCDHSDYYTLVGRAFVHYCNGPDAVGYSDFDLTDTLINFVLVVEASSPILSSWDTVVEDLPKNVAFKHFAVRGEVGYARCRS